VTGDVVVNIGSCSDDITSGNGLTCVRQIAAQSDNR